MTTGVQGPLVEAFRREAMELEAAQSAQVAADVVTALLNNFQLEMIAGREKLQSLTEWVFYRLVVIDLVLLGIAMSQEGIQSIGSFFKKIFTISILGYCISNWPYIVQSITGFFITVGALGANQDPGVSYLDPVSIIRMGVETFVNLMAIAKENEGYVAPGMTALCAIAASILQLIGFTLLAAIVIITLLEFWIVAHLSLAFIPFALLKKTSFLGEKAFQVCVSFGVKFMVLTFIIAVTGPVLDAVAQASYSSSNLAALFLPLVTVFLILVVALNAPKVAAGLLSGQGGALGLGSIVSTAGAVAGAAYGAGKVGALAAKGAAGAARAGVEVGRGTVAVAARKLGKDS